MLELARAWSSLLELALASSSFVGLGRVCSKSLGVALVSLFYESDGEVHYIDPRDELFDEVENLQDQLGADVRAFEFELVGERFKTAFTYRDQFDDKADDLGRRSVVLMKHFGHRREST